MLEEMPRFRDTSNIQRKGNRPGQPSRYITPPERGEHCGEELGSGGNRQNQSSLVGRSKFIGSGFQF